MGLLTMPLTTLSESTRVQEASAGLAWPRRAGLLLLNAVPLLHLAGTVGVFFLPVGWLARIGTAVGVLYLVPPVLTRMLLAFARVPEGRIEINSKAFMVWWATFQMQTLFCRFVMIEEALRLVPGLYSLWLRLWGARIGRLTYWSPGTTITDRTYLDIGDDVVFGAGVRLNSHVMCVGPEGRFQLALGTIRVGPRSLVGGYSLLTAGSEIAPNEITKAFLLSPPFSSWKDGRRLRDPKGAPDA